MKHIILVILGVSAVFGALVFMQNKQIDKNQVVLNVEDSVQKTADAAKSMTNEARVKIESAAEVLQAQAVDPSVSLAEMEVTAYEPELEVVQYTDKDGNEHIFKVELATKLAEVQKGLMFRRSMPEDQGMLFVFPVEEEKGFWMKNTYIPLDMFFIKSDGTIHKVHKGAVPLSPEVIFSEGPVKYVLELNAGIADKFGILAGDTFHHEIFINKLAE